MSGEPPACRALRRGLRAGLRGLSGQRGENLGRDEASGGGIGDRAAVGADDIEHVHRLRAERLHPGRAHVEAAFAQGTADPPEQSGGVVCPHLHQGGGAGGRPPG